MSSTPADKTGACLCGKVKYQLSGPSATALYNTICHCINCRRGTGSALLTASICPKEGFKITEGENVLKTYIDNKTDSGKPLQRKFCSECGSMLFAVTPLREDIVSVAAGTLDDFESWRPDTEQYCIHRADFMQRVKGVEGGSRHVTSVRSEAEGS